MRTMLARTLAVGFGFLLACSGGGGSGIGAPSPPQEEAHVTTSSLDVTATITAATLGEDCGGGGSESKFAPSADCVAGDAGSCGRSCQPSNLQIAFTSGAGTTSAPIAIVSVKLVEAATGKEVDTLNASDPRSWTGTGYTAWDERVAPSTQLKASYELSAPKWSTIAGAKGGVGLYSQKYRLHVTVRIDGTEVVLTSTDLTREPSVVT